MPQLIENYRTGSADAVSLTFVIVWFLGDIANLIGAVWAGLVPTVIALAIYFCIADVLLILQCLYYRREKRQKNKLHPPSLYEEGAHEPLLSNCQSNVSLLSSRRNSSKSLRRPNLVSQASEKRQSWRTCATNGISVVLVCSIGVAGCVLAWQGGLWKIHDQTAEPSKGSTGAVIVGYLSAIAYLGYVCLNFSIPIFGKLNDW